MTGEVAGLVLLEPAHEDYNAYMPGPLIERHISPERLRTGFGRRVTNCGSTRKGPIHSRAANAGS